MRKMICALFALLLPSVLLANAPYGLRGEQLPRLLRDAALTADVSVDSVVLVRPSDRQAFEADHGETLKKYGSPFEMTKDGDFRIGFTIGLTLPIYVNGVTARPNEVTLFSFLSSAYESQPEKLNHLKFLYAAQFRHEKIHAEGNASEVTALQSQIAFWDEHCSSMSQEAYLSEAVVLESQLAEAKQMEAEHGVFYAHLRRR